MATGTVNEDLQREIDRAAAVTPGGSQTWSKAPGRVGPRVTTAGAEAFPVFAYAGHNPAGAMGSPWLVGWSDGRIGETPVLDCFGANAAIPLGYQHPGVAKAVARAMADGPLLSLPSFKEVGISSRFLELCAPWAKQVRWVKTGSEAMSAAVRIARAATGRAKIVVFDNSYHGWHDWTAARDGRSVLDIDDDMLTNGVPAAMLALVSVAPYGSFALQRVLDDQVAAVVVEAHRFQATDPDWLRHVVTAAHAAGALVIFDEMVYGLRWALGGAAEYYGVTPDLATFGKALGNGVPIACVCGTADVMGCTIRAGISGTYGGDLLGLYAAEAVLMAHIEHNFYDTRRPGTVIEQLWESGRQLWAAYQFHAPAAFPLEGFPVHWRLPQALTEDERDAVLIECINHRVLVHRSSNNASVAMSPDEVWMAGRVIGSAVAAAIGRRA